MHWFILMAGALIASSIGLALVGLVLREAIRNSRRPVASKTLYTPRRVSHAYAKHSALRLPLSRGYDSPEIQREDTFARTKQSDNDLNYQ